MSPRVSLALPVHNGEKFIKEAIRSILIQDYEDFELIITDNASTDATEKICREFAAFDSRVRHIRNEHNLGAAPNFNRGFELSSGVYFKWCAYDDLLSPNFLAQCVGCLDQDPAAVLAYGTTECIDQDGRSIPPIGSMMPDMDGRAPAHRFHKVIADWCACYEIFGVFRRDALKSSSLHRSYYGSDRALLAELALIGRFVHVPDIVFYNRAHADRSLNIADKGLKRAWLDAATKSKYALEHWPLLGHLIEIAIRRRHIVPAYKTLAYIFAWAMTPLQLSRYVLELIGLASPSAQFFLRKTGWHVLDTLQKTARLMRRQKA